MIEGQSHDKIREMINDCLYEGDESRLAQIARALLDKLIELETKK